MMVIAKVVVLEEGIIVIVIETIMLPEIKMT